MQTALKTSDAGEECNTTPPSAVEVGRASCLSRLHVSDTSASRLLPPYPSTAARNRPLSCAAPCYKTESAAATGSLKKPKSDWCHPLDALQRQRDSARAAYTPYSVAAADLAAAHQAELVAQQLFPQLPIIDHLSAGKGFYAETGKPQRRLLRPSSSKLVDLLPPLTTAAESTGWTSAPQPPPWKSQDSSMRRRTFASIAGSTPPAPTRSGNPHPATSLAGYGTPFTTPQMLSALGPRPASTSRNTSRRLFGNTAEAANGSESFSSVTPKRLSDRSSTTDSTIAEHYAHLTHLLRGYHDDALTATPPVFHTTAALAAAEDASLLPLSLRQSSDVPKRAAEAAAAAVTETFPPTSAPASQLSADASATTVCGDGFWHFVTERRASSLRASPWTHADFTRFQRHLQHYFDRQLRSLLRSEECERAQLQMDGLRALRTLLGLHDRYRDYVVLRTRQAASLAGVKAQEVVLRDVYPGPCLLEPLHAVEEEAARNPLEVFLRTAPADRAVAFVELQGSPGTSRKASAARVQEEELVADSHETMAMVAALQEAFQELVPTLDFDRLDTSVSTAAKVAPPLQPFEELRAEPDVRADVVALQQQFEELVPTIKTKASAHHTEAVAETAALETPAADASTSREREVSVQEAFEELVDPHATACVEDQNEAEPQLPTPFQELEDTAETHAKALPPSEPFEELHACPATKAEVAELQETFEELSLLRLYVELQMTTEEALRRPLPTALNSCEELVADDDISSVTAALQEVFEELFPELESKASASVHSAGEMQLVPDPYEELEVSATTHTRVAHPTEPFAELEAGASIKERLAALQEVFEELRGRAAFEELVPTADTHRIASGLPKPFVQLITGSGTAAEEAALQEYYEELTLPVEVNHLDSSLAGLMDARPHEPFEELSADTRLHRGQFEELEVGVDTEAAAAALREVFEELIPHVKHAEHYVGVEVSDAAAAPATVTSETREAREGPTSATAAFSWDRISNAVEATHTALHAYCVGAPEALVDVENRLHQVTCSFTDLTLDGFATAATVGDVFAEVCGARSPVVVACERWLVGTNWCAHLLTAGAAVRECVVADVCAALECAPVRVRNVTLVATAADGEADTDDAARESIIDGDNGDMAAGNFGAGLVVRFDVVHDAGFALYPQDEVRYLVHECKFPFLQQWCRSRAALLCLQRRRRSSASSAVKLLSTGGSAASSHGVAIPLWAYTAQAPHSVRKNAPKLSSARLPFPLGLQSVASNLSIGHSSHSGGGDVAAAAAAGEDAGATAPISLGCSSTASSAGHQYLR
jgi:hypothetical protein